MQKFINTLQEAKLAHEVKPVAGVILTPAMLTGVEILPVYELNGRPIFPVDTSSNCSKMIFENYKRADYWKTQRRITG